MGTSAQLIANLDRKSLVSLLNRLVADEWLAYYQYWIGSKIARGPLRSTIVKELSEHAEDELKHVNLLSDRIIQLGGVPILSPNDWSTNCNCPFITPTTSHSIRILSDNLKGERCAIKTYSSVLEILRARDPVTCMIIRDILKDEVEHEEDLQALFEDFKVSRAIYESDQHLLDELRKLSTM